MSPRPPRHGADGADGAAPITVVLEFPGSGTAGRIRAMDLESQGFTTRYLLDEFRPRRTGIDEYARQLSERVAEEDVGAVVSYCGAAAVGRHLAAHCRRRPTLVALNPEPTPAAGVAGLLRRTLARVPLPPEEAERYLADADTVREVIAGWLPDMERAMARSYAGAPLNLGPVADRLAAMQADWLAHVTATCDPDRRPAGPEELHLVARDHPCDPDCPAKHETVEVGRADFFAAPQTRDALIGVLSA
ncbi:hypothetical protein [Actinacidiphila sp. bgisy145]|uniref:hypothetical protein n=1 Tax=Actinacidiphila sp. bgisy145 TaxID=3413792 RepID=UPI003EBE87E1